MEKLKILYAAGNNENGKVVLSRFLKAINGKPFTVKIAAFKKSSPKNVSVDWTLDCLLNIFKPDHLSTENDNFEIYFEQVKYFAPDLIISDMEYFTSYIANVLNITLWQCSSSLINFAVENKEKYNLGLFKRYSFLLEKNNAIRTQRQINMIDNSNANLVYSHLGDTKNPPQIKNNFEWIRPYHIVGKESIPCQHNIIAGIPSNNKDIFSILKQYPDSVAFTEFYDETYPNLILKDIENSEEYFCNLKNSNLFVCEGQTSFLADAFYNGKYSAVFTDFKDIECITNSLFSENLSLSASVTRYDDLNQLINISVDGHYDESIKLLHEKIEEL